MKNGESGFITILTGLYSYQDCVHFLASVRKFHDEPIVIVTGGVPPFLTWLLRRFKNVQICPAPAHLNPVLASRFAKVDLLNLSPFEKTIYLDCDICLLENISEVFDGLENYDLLLTLDIRDKVSDAINLLRVEQSFEHEYDVVSELNSVGIPVTYQSVHYNSGLLAFKNTESNHELFKKYSAFFDIVLRNQEKLLLRDQAALAAAIESVGPKIKVLPFQYNFLSKWKSCYPDSSQTIKVLHCTYPIRPQYAKEITRSMFTRVFDKLAKYLLPSQTANPWRSSKPKN